jgi:hypothetical protein
MEPGPQRLTPPLAQLLPPQVGPGPQGTYKNPARDGSRLRLMKVPKLHNVVHGETANLRLRGGDLTNGAETTRIPWDSYVSSCGARAHRSCPSRVPVARARRACPSRVSVGVARVRRRRACPSRVSVARVRCACPSRVSGGCDARLGGQAAAQHEQFGRKRVERLPQ